MREIMKRDIVRSSSGLAVCVFALLLVPFIFSCGRDKPGPKKQASVVTSTYSNESVFVDVKNKLRDHPEDAESWYHLADLYDRNSQYAEAIEAYGKAVALQPGKGYAYLKMGTAYDRMNRPAEAVDALKKAAKLMPGNAVVYNNLGVAYGKLGRTRDEIAALKKAVQLRPRYVSARFNMGMAWLKLKNAKAAMKEYEALDEIDGGAAEKLLKEIKGDAEGAAKKP